VGGGSVVGEGARVTGAVLGRRVTVAPGVVISGMVVAGDDATFPDGLVIDGGASIPSGATAGDTEAR